MLRNSTVLQHREAQELCLPPGTRVPTGMHMHIRDVGYKYGVMYCSTFLSNYPMYPGTFVSKPGGETFVPVCVAFRHLRTEMSSGAWPQLPQKERQMHIIELP